MLEYMMAMDPERIVTEKSKLPPLRVLCVSILICMGSMGLGTVFGFPAPAFSGSALSSYNFQMTHEEKSWAVGVANIGGFVGGLSGRLLIDIFGRKSSLFLLITILSIGWMFILISKYFWMLCFGRLLTGVAVGIAWICSPVFVAEISPTENRGFLLMIHSYQLSFGIFWTYLICEFLSWKWLIVSYLAFNFFSIICLLFIPESPRWLLLHGYGDGAKWSLQWYRQTEDVNKELNDMRATILNSCNKFEMKEIFKKELYYPLLLTIVLVTVQIWGGINVVNVYIAQIFQAAGMSLDPLLCGTISSGIRLVGNFPVIWLNNCVGRRPLLIVSSVGMTVSFVLLAVYFQLKAKYEIFLDLYFFWFPIAAISIYLLTFNIGWSQIPSAMIGELLPLKIRGFAGGLSISIAWIWIIVSVQLYPTIVENINQSAPFYLFAAFAVVGFLFTAFVLPETKGKTLEEIEQSFRSK
ncbi:Facilitated trehalose transporter Tret1 [Chamberlinius hualienensis]